MCVSITFMILNGAVRHAAATESFTELVLLRVAAIAHNRQHCAKLHVEIAHVACEDAHALRLHCAHLARADPLQNGQRPVSLSCGDSSADPIGTLEEEIIRCNWKRR
eukprot:CAMPEP_0174754394 /NCGR_PEP_ID=MMETSP1094-20130205/105712_1 /TAXON_ID=156173 /ORGANISM="Chrysochromulina brevifilum, Strain UTEX LB 985" /LENGTH=106 /DNA_ID=CAMNT_0015960259 /DNA_START=350 /DNA_END=670 /DNA_ORIENTATION=+